MQTHADPPRVSVPPLPLGLLLPFPFFAQPLVVAAIAIRRPLRDAELDHERRAFRLRAIIEHFETLGLQAVHSQWTTPF